MPPIRVPPSIRPALLRAYRARTFRLTRRLRLRTPEQAVEFVNERGFVFFWTIEGVDLPSLWTAVAGDRPVASEHDDPGHVTWGWKDAQLGRRRWFYGKLLRGKSMMVSLKTLPYFYALSDRLGDLDDFDLAYEAGRLSREARAVADVLLRHGAQHTVALRRLARLSSETSKAPFDKAISDLQRGLWVLPVGVAEAGAWHYAFIYELVDRWLPALARKARRISRVEAQRHLAGLYLDSVGVALPAAVRGLFRWPAGEVEAALEALRAGGAAIELADGSWATMRLLKPKA
jgi:uncharacterized protein YcaQ